MLNVPTNHTKELLDAKAVLVGSGNTTMPWQEALRLFWKAHHLQGEKNKSTLALVPMAGQILSQRKSMPRLGKAGITLLNDEVVSQNYAE